MKGYIEEYGTFVATAIVGMIILSYLLNSITSPQGAIHKYAVVNMENMGAETKVIVEEWDVNGVKATLKDDGGLYFTGTGTLPTYSSVKDTPWADMAGDIVFVIVEDGVMVSGDIPIE